MLVCWVFKHLWFTTEVQECFVTEKFVDCSNIRNPVGLFPSQFVSWSLPVIVWGEIFGAAFFCELFVWLNRDYVVLVPASFHAVDWHQSHNYNKRVLRNPRSSSPGRRRIWIKRAMRWLFSMITLNIMLQSSFCSLLLYPFIQERKILRLCEGFARQSFSSWDLPSSSCDPAAFENRWFLFLYAFPLSRLQWWGFFAEKRKLGDRTTDTGCALPQMCLLSQYITSTFKSARTILNICALCNSTVLRSLAITSLSFFHTGQSDYQQYEAGQLYKSLLVFIKLSLPAKTNSIYVL